MTCREKLKIEHPEDFERLVVDGEITCCPWEHSYADMPEPPEDCGPWNLDGCNKCWDREFDEGYYKKGKEIAYEFYAKLKGEENDQV